MISFFALFSILLQNLPQANAATVLDGGTGMFGRCVGTMRDVLGPIPGFIAWNFTPVVYHSYGGRTGYFYIDQSFDVDRALGGFVAYKLATHVHFFSYGLKPAIRLDVPFFLRKERVHVVADASGNITERRTQETEKNPTRNANHWEVSKEEVAGVLRDFTIKLLRRAGEYYQKAKLERDVHKMRMAAAAIDACDLGDPGVIAELARLTEVLRPKFKFGVRGSP